MAVVYAATMSLDGYIAGPGGDMQWLVPYLGANPEAEELARRTGALLIGARTLFGDDPHRGTDREGAFGSTGTGRRSCSRTPRRPSPCRRHLPRLLGRGAGAAEAAAGDGDVAVLGADVARQCLQTGHLDTVLVVVAPVLLGDGTRLLDLPGGTNVRLQPLNVTPLDQVTNLWMRVVR